MHFHIEVTTCMATNPNCKPKSEVDALLSKIFFTMANANGKVQLKNNNDHAAKPVSVVEEFHSQFTLNTNAYRDNNNFLVFNKVETMDSRLLNLVSTKYRFLDLIQKPAWTTNQP